MKQHALNATYSVDIPSEPKTFIGKLLAKLLHFWLYATNSNYRLECDMATILSQEIQKEIDKEIINMMCELAAQENQQNEEVGSQITQRRRSD
jgi:lipopolysaccharide biosynthesis regulator YciM